MARLPLASCGSRPAASPSPSATWSKAGPGCAEGHCRADSAAHGPSPSHGGEMVFVRVRSTGRCARSRGYPRLRQPGNASGACPRGGLARERFAASIERIRGILPQSEVVALSPAAISFRRHGLEFAQARIAHDREIFKAARKSLSEWGRKSGCSTRQMRLSSPISFNWRQPCATRMARRITRSGACIRTLAESLVCANLTALDGRLRPEPVYAQVPAFAAADRAMIDILAVTRESRLAVIELKADEDIHLPLQGVDYWSRVAGTRAAENLPNSAISRITRSPAETSLAAGRARSARASDHRHYPALSVARNRVGVLGIDEHWREEIRVVFRKKPSRAPVAVPA